MSKHLGFLLVVALSFSFAAVAEEPQWLKEARAREARSVKETSIKSTDGFFTGRVFGKLRGDIAGKDGEYIFLVDIGSETPMTCEVIADGFDLSATLRSTAQAQLQELEKIQGKIEQKALEASDAGVLGSSPYIATDWIYRVNDGKGVRLGKLKQIAVTKGDHGLYCAHPDLGFTKTFFNAVRSLAESLQFSKQTAAPHYSEVSTATMAGSKVGIAVVSMERDAEGDTKIVTITSLVVRVTAEDVRTQDAVHVQWVRPDGSLINGVHVVTTDGEVETNLKLNEADDGKWQVKGTFKGKELDQAIPGDAQPTTWLQMASERRKAFARGDIAGTKLTSAVWLTADPTRFVHSHTTLLSALDAQRISASEDLSGIKAEHVLDRATGYPLTSKMEIGPVSIQLDRVLTQGSF